MKDLKILFIEDVKKDLKLTIHELRKESNGYFSLHHAPIYVKENLAEYVLKNDAKFCYVITLENKILEVIYKDKVRILNPVVENLYKYKEIENNSKILSKNLKHTQ